MDKPLTLGAESTIYLIERWGRSLLLKQRPEKPYLLKAIDAHLRASRTNRECKMLTIARGLNVPTPTVHWVDKTNHIIVMDYIEGHQLRQLVNDVSSKKLKSLCNEFGKLIGLLHEGDMVHGDPTTSNVLVDRSSKMWLIDFGLAELNATVEMKGVDLHLMKRAFETTHWDLQGAMLDSALQGYRKHIGTEAEPIIQRMEQIRERGRYH